MRFGSVAVSNALFVLATAALSGAVGIAATAPPTHPSVGIVHQGAPIYIAPAPDQYNPLTIGPSSPAPARLLITRLGVVAPVEALGLNQDFSLQAPTGVATVGWYRLGPPPGAPGDAIISGHRGYPGGTPAIFNELAQLRPGDSIRVQRVDGTAVEFTVTRIYATPSTTVPPGFFETDGAPRLTLITCTGNFDSHSLTYNQRLLVEAAADPGAAATAHPHGDN